MKARSSAIDDRGRKGFLVLLPRFSRAMRTPVSSATATSSLTERWLRSITAPRFSNAYGSSSGVGWPVGWTMAVRPPTSPRYRIASEMRAMLSRRISSIELARFTAVSGVWIVCG